MQVKIQMNVLVMIMDIQNIAPLHSLLKQVVKERLSVYNSLEMYNEIKLFNYLRNGDIYFQNM